MEMQESKFNLKTHKFDGRGRLVGKSPYRMHVVSGEALFERPVNSGNLFYENGDPAGRVEYTKGPKGQITGKTFKRNEAHKAYVPPLSGAEKVSAENENLKAENLKLMAELEAIRAEQAAKQAEAKLPSAAAPVMKHDAKSAIKAAASGKPAAGSSLHNLADGDL